MMASERLLSRELSEFARTMATDFPIQGILDHLVRKIVELLPITSAGVTLISPSQMPRYVAASDDSALRYEKLQSELGEGPCLSAYGTGKPVFIADLSRDERFEAFGPQALEAGLVAVFAFPLYQGDKRLGALDLYRETAGELSEADMEAAQTLADVAAAYLINAQARADLHAASDRSYQASIHDALTGLPNRILLLERLDHALMRGTRSDKQLAILFIDLDKFKAVNDAHGHRTGDELLVSVTRRLSSLLRPGDTLARLSGDEFVVLCEDLGQESHAEMIATRIVNALGFPFLLSGVEVTISASVGVAFAGRGKDDPEQLLQDADLAMYQAKQLGGDHHRIIDLREQHVAENRDTLQHDLRGALGREELRVHYQPIVATKDGQMVGVEALLRWEHPLRGTIPPTTLIPLAEQGGFIAEIGRWVLRQACSDRRRWVAQSGQSPLGLAVNVSAHQLMAPGFATVVAEVLAETGTSPELLTLEITESVFIRDRTRALIVLRELKDLGVVLALDDFGTGYSSLIYLNRFPVDVVKIDSGFTATVVGDRASHAIVCKVIELAHLLGMTVVTEGVETAEQLDAVAQLGSDSCQGFYFARPMSAASLDSLLDSAELELRLPLPV